MKLPYKEGTWFAVPLEKGGFGVGCVARHSPKGVTVLGYFFGPKRDDIPTYDEVCSLQPDRSVLVRIVGDLGLIDGTWPIISDSTAWNRHNWPVPAFSRQDELTKTAWLVRYSDDDPEVLVSRERIPYEPGVPSTDISCGAGYIEAVLTDLLDP